ncbi:MAG: hypothetical protein ACUVWN_02975 [bacterium]
MEPEKLEKYKDATEIALLNAYSSGLLTKEEYQIIQRFKHEKWESIQDFLKQLEEKEYAKNLDSTNIDTSKFVESTYNVGSVYAESISSRKTLFTGTYYETESFSTMLAKHYGLSSVEIESNFTKFDNEVSDYLNSMQTPIEQSIYNRLYRLAVGQGKNYCRVSAESLMKACNIKDRRTLNSGLDGLIKKGHISAINRNNRGVLYRIFLPREVSSKND